MKGKYFIILSLGTVGGFIGGNIFAFDKILRTDKMRKALVSSLTDKVENFLFDEQPSNGTAQYQNIHYHNYYNRTRHSPIEVVMFDTKDDAINILKQMETIINDYGYASISDFYNLSGVKATEYLDSKWGWLSLDKVEICRRYNGWEIMMPKALPIK